MEQRQQQEQDVLNQIKEELNNKRATEQSLKDKLGIK